MNTTKLQKSLAVLVALVVAFAMLGASTATSHAGLTGKKMPKKQYVIWEDVRYPGYTLNDQTVYKFKKKVSSVKSSKKAVASAKVAQKKFVIVTPKKKGTTKITVKSGGKKYTMKLMIVGYKNPFKKIVVFDSDLTGDFKTMSGGKTFSAWVKSDSGKMNVSLNKGFSKLTLTIGGKKVPANGTVSVPADGSMLQAKYYNNATKRYEVRMISIFQYLSSGDDIS